MGRQAFNGPRGQVFYADPHRVLIIGLDTPHGEGDHPLWDERIHLPVDEALAKNILRFGNKEAVKVRKNGRYPDDHPHLPGEDIIEVVEGRQRTRSCRRAQELANEQGCEAPLLKIEFERGSEEEMIGVMISLNEQRRDDSPMIRARKAARVLALGHDEKSVANMFGVTTAAIRQWRKAVELHTSVQKAVDQGAISFSAALQLHGLSTDEQQSKLKEILASGIKPTTEETKAAARSNGRQRSTPVRRTILSKKVLRKLEEDETWLEGLSPDARALFRVLRGDHNAIGEVPGLASKLEV